MTIIEMIDEIDRLVSNNGTVSQIKPIIIPLREQAEAMEKRVRTLESKSKVKNLEGQVSFLREQLDAALKQIQEAEDGKQSAHGSGRSDIETQILVFLSKHNDGIPMEHIGPALSLGPQVVELHLRDLQEIEYVHTVYYYETGTLWLLNTKGQRYLFDRGLLK